ncbi:MAG: histidine kinase [Chloroflexota bacterium]
MQMDSMDSTGSTRLDRRRLWPAFVFLALEVLALASLTWLPQRPAVLATRFSLGVAFLVLLAGWLPALLRPVPGTLLAACLATVMASILITPLENEDLPGYFLSTPVIQAAPAYLLLRLVNGALLGPLLFHLAARFPRRAHISDRSLAWVYAASLALLFIVLLAGAKTLRIVAGWSLLAWTGGLAVAAAVLLLRVSRSSAPEERRAAQQARLLFLCLVLAETPALLRPLGLFLRFEFVSYNFFLAAQILVPLGVAYAVLRHDLFGIDSALRRGLAYAALSLLLLAVYFGLTVGLTALLANVWSQFRGAAAVFSLFVAALGFEPLRKRVQRGIDQALYPDRLNFQRAVGEAQAALGRVVSRQEVIHLLTDELPARLGAEWASLSLFPAPDVPGRTDPEPAWNAQLVVAGQPLGRYWLGPRRAGPSYDRDEQAQLRILSGQAALALAYADTIEALRQLNRELEARVEQRTAQVLHQQRALAAFEERQRLARELHDSVTQALFSMNLSARALRGLVRRDPPAAVSGLSELEAAAQQALAEMRALLAQLRAPQGEQIVEEQADLVGLVRQYCAQLEREAGAAHLKVELDSPESLLLPNHLAHELLQMIKEGLHNVRKHSGVAQANCRILPQGGRLRLWISDRGGGFDPQQAGASGFGLRGMRERVQSLGGDFEIETQPGSGTTLKVSIPIGEAAR